MSSPFSAMSFALNSTSDLSRPHGLTLTLGPRTAGDTSPPLLTAPCLSRCPLPMLSHTHAPERPIFSNSCPAPQLPWIRGLGWDNAGEHLFLA